MEEPSKALVWDLQIEIRRLARRATVMNLGLASGVPLNMVDFLIRPVEESAAQVRSLIRQSWEVGLENLHVEVNKPISDELAQILADAINSDVPDDLSSLSSEEGGWR